MMGYNVLNRVSMGIGPTLSTNGGRKSEGKDLSPAPRSYIFTARRWSTLLVPGILYL